jgi:Ca2+-binding EF-hand superfamily protein
MRHRLFTALFVVALLALVCLLGGERTGLAQVPVQYGGPPMPAEKPKPGEPLFADPGARDVQDVVIFADSRPLLIRLHVLIDNKPYQDVWDEYVGKLLAYLDLDGDGVLTKKEMERIPQPQDLRMLAMGQVYNLQGQFARPDEIDISPKDGKITREELAAYYKKGGIRALQVNASSGRDQSGKVTKALFKYLDVNKDGKLSKDELAAAPALLHKLDLDDDEMIGRDEVLPNNREFYNDDVEFVDGYYRMRQRIPEPPPLMPLIPGEPVMPLVRQLLARYDKNGDQKLSSAELSLDTATFEDLDSNGDGKLDATELVRWFSRPCDVELIDRLLPAHKDGNTLLQPLFTMATQAIVKSPFDIFKTPGRTPRLTGIVSVDGSRLLLTLHNARMELTTGKAIADPINRTFILNQFRELDKDKKGYLERKDVEGDLSGYLRPLFPLADRNGDGKLYEEELIMLLDLASKGNDSMVSLTFSDQGKGLFELLDANGDGKLGLRELRTAWTRLEPYDHDGDGQLSLAEVPKFYQGSVAFPLFDRSPAQNAAAKKGPLWFRKMDRNGDGDISLREWLGSEEDFLRLDTDGDGLISVEEAERGEALLKKEIKELKP